ncbi:S8 family serine peptidase [Candidatus Woesearchaeota archaeon]|nr:S8 family serine peptidase [Candidatus Woesearchaeota archaeon]
MRRILSTVFAISLGLFGCKTTDTSLEWSMDTDRARMAAENVDGETEVSNGESSLENRLNDYPNLFWNRALANYPDPETLPRLRKIVVAVLDTGVACDISALEGKCLPGYDFIKNDKNASDDNGHGTHIATLIAGKQQPGNPFYGLCPNCRIVPIKTLDRKGLGDPRSFSRGLRLAVDLPVDIINMSSGWDPGHDPGKEVSSAIRAAVEKDIIVVAAVGNEGRVGKPYPAAYPGVIGVGTVNADGQRPPYSNISPAVDLVAPGGDDRDREGDGMPESIVGYGITMEGIHSSMRMRHELWLYSGTSHACAHVSALAGILLGVGASPENILPLMEWTARDIEPKGFDFETGAGLIDFTAALRAVEQGEDIHRRHVPYTPLRYSWTENGNVLRILLLDTITEERWIIGYLNNERMVDLPIQPAGYVDLNFQQLGVKPETYTSFLVERIIPNTPSSTAMEGRPYEGVLAAPLSRYIHNKVHNAKRP